MQKSKNLRIVLCLAFVASSLTFYGNLVLSASDGTIPEKNGQIKTLISAITVCMPYISFPRTLNALGCINEIIPEK